MRRVLKNNRFFFCLVFALFSNNLFAQLPDPIEFADDPLKEDIILPDWFKVSFLDLKEDLDEALSNNKKGLIIYYGQSLCPYCKAHLNNNWGQKDILSYTLKHFDVIAINVRGQKQVVDFDGNEYTEKQFSVKELRIYIVYVAKMKFIYRKLYFLIQKVHKVK